ncbi:MAG: hypothetical protein QOG30_474 [Acidimicrobiaceae bacterium]|jgi:hypothetical protein
MKRERPWWLDVRSSIPEDSIAARFIVWVTTPLQWLTRKPRPLLYGVLMLGQVALLVLQLVTGHGVRVSTVLVLPLGAWLTYRQWRAKQNPRDYPWPPKPASA